MKSARVEKVRLAGIATAVPDSIREVAEFGNIFGNEEIQKISKSTGVERRAVGEKLCCSDLCFEAAKRLLSELNWQPDTIDGLIFVSQSFDFPLPATSCILQMRLGLPKSCAAFDIALGCSGYVYGLWVATSLIASGGLKRVILMVGDVHRGVSPLDRSTALLFGDAGTATALEANEFASEINFCLGTDGNGWMNLIVPSGFQSSRRPRDESTRIRKKAEANNIRSQEDLFMDGAEIFSFTINEVPPLISETLSCAGWKKEEVDYFIFHQANKFMLTHIAKAMELPLEKVPLSLKDYGNTSSASIPVTINAELGNMVTSNEVKMLLAGFGVGYSWGACTVKCGPIISPSILRINEAEAWKC
jgi:3-oxoacyl-[acyl-carrier-protein] synthase III